MVEDLLESLKQAWEAGDANGAAQLYLEGAIHQDGVGRHGTTFRGQVAIRKGIDEMFAVRESKFVVTRIFSAGDWGAAEWIFSWVDSRSSSRLAIHGASLFEFRDGLVARETSYYDPEPASAPPPT
jgi:SnoaL-like domain